MLALQKDLCEIPSPSLDININFTAISINVVGSKRQSLKTGPQGDVHPHVEFFIT